MGKAFSAGMLARGESHLSPTASELLWEVEDGHEVYRWCHERPCGSRARLCVDASDSCYVVLRVEFGSGFTSQAQNQPHTLLPELLLTVLSSGPSDPGGLMSSHAVLPTREATPLL